MTKVKVCGLRPGDDLNFTHDERVSHVGVVFVPQSRRYISPTEASAIVKAVHGRTRVMGVFADATDHQLISAIKQSGVHGAQLHGQESPKTCADLRNEGFEVWKALKVMPTETASDVYARILLYSNSVDGILLDAAPPKDADPRITGGHGKSFDWDILRTLELLAQNHSLPPLWVAGGLTPDNVPMLLRDFTPFGVDVSSGVETEGQKDVEKISAFIEAVKQSA